MSGRSRRGRGRPPRVECIEWDEEIPVDAQLLQVSTAAAVEEQDPLADISPPEEVKAPPRQRQSTRSSSRSKKGVKGSNSSPILVVEQDPLEEISSEVKTRQRGRISKKVSKEPPALVTPVAQTVPSKPELGYLNLAALEAEMDKNVSDVIDESLYLFQMDPREYHPFYLRIYKYIRIGQQRGFITSQKQEKSYWEKYDGICEISVKSILNAKGVSRSFIGEESPYATYIKTRRVIVNGREVHLNRNQTEIDKLMQELEKSARELVDQRKRLRRSNTQIKDIRGDLVARLNFFNLCKTVTFPADCVRMNKIWRSFINEFSEPVKSKSISQPVKQTLGRNLKGMTPSLPISFSSEKLAIADGTNENPIAIDFSSDDDNDNFNDCEDNFSENMDTGSTFHDNDEEDSLIPREELQKPESSDPSLSRSSTSVSNNKIVLIRTKPRKLSRNEIDKTIKISRVTKQMTKGPLLVASTESESNRRPTPIKTKPKLVKFPKKKLMPSKNKPGSGGLGGSKLSQLKRLMKRKLMKENSEKRQTQVEKLICLKRNLPEGRKLKLKKECSVEKEEKVALAVKKNSTNKASQGHRVKQSDGRLRLNHSMGSKSSRLKKLRKTLGASSQNQRQMKVEKLLCVQGSLPNRRKKKIVRTKKDKNQLNQNSNKESFQSFPQSPQALSLPSPPSPSPLSPEQPEENPEHLVLAVSNKHENVDESIANRSVASNAGEELISSNSLAELEVEHTSKGEDESALCDGCGKIFDCEEDVRKHKRAFYCGHSECPICQRKIVSPQFMWAHFLVIHTSEGRERRGASSYKDNLLPKNEESVFSSYPNFEGHCELCGKFIVTNLRRHMIQMHDPNNRRFQCPDCGKLFKGKDVMDAHRKQVHLGESVRCDLCGRKFQGPGKLWKHKVDGHQLADLEPPPGMTVYKCNYCSQSLLRGMYQHVQKHHPDKLLEYKQSLSSNTNNDNDNSNNNNSNSLSALIKGARSNRKEWKRMQIKIFRETGVGPPHLLKSGNPTVCAHCGINLPAKNRSFWLAHLKEAHNIETAPAIKGNNPPELLQAFSCPLADCNESFSSYATREYHLLNFHMSLEGILKETGFIRMCNEDVSFSKWFCNICDTSFRSFPDIMIHYILKHQQTVEKYKQEIEFPLTIVDAPVECPFQCGETFEKHKTLREHLQANHSELCWKCPECETALIDSLDMQEHFMLEHNEAVNAAVQQRWVEMGIGPAWIRTKVAPKNCPKCKLEVADLQFWQDHVNEVHNGDYGKSVKKRLPNKPSNYKTGEESNSTRAIMRRRWVEEGIGPPSIRTRVAPKNCPLCKLEIRDLQFWRKHVKEVHNGYYGKSKRKEHRNKYTPARKLALKRWVEEGIGCTWIRKRTAPRNCPHCNLQMHGLQFWKNHVNEEHNGNYGNDKSSNLVPNRNKWKETTERTSRYLVSKKLWREKGVGPWWVRKDVVPRKCPFDNCGAVMENCTLKFWRSHVETVHNGDYGQDCQKGKGKRPGGFGEKSTSKNETNVKATSSKKKKIVGRKKRRESTDIDSSSDSDEQMDFYSDDENVNENRNFVVSKNNTRSRGRSKLKPEVDLSGFQLKNCVVMVERLRKSELEKFLRCNR